MGKNSLYDIYPQWSSRTSECKNTSIYIRNSNPTDDTLQGSVIYVFITQRPFDFKRYNKNPTNKTKYSPCLEFI